MSEKLILIDGHSILNRAFYGVPDLTNAEGIHTNALYGFLNILFKFLDEEKPDYITVAFDLSAPTFRHKVFDGYKGTRKPMQPELKQQVPLMKELLKAMNITVVEQEGFEADDILGTIAKESAAKGIDVSIISGDRDLLQLADEHIKIRIPKTKKGVTEVEDYYPADVIELYGVTPLEFIDVKALMGDTSDNIPGAPGVGPKTASAIIQKYHNLDNVFEHLDELKPPKAKTSISVNIEQIKMSRFLSEIKIDVPIDYNIENAKTGDFFNENSYELFKKYNFKNMLKKFENTDITAKDPDCYEYFKKISDFAEVENVFNKAADIADRIEKIGLSIIRENELTADGITLSDTEIYYIPVSGFVTESYLTERLLDVVSKASDRNIASANIKDYLDIFEKDKINGYPLVSEKAFIDTAIAAYLLHPSNESYDYESLGREFLSLTYPSKTELLGKLSINKAVNEAEDNLIKYACLSSYAYYKCADKITEQLKCENMYELFETIEMPLIFVLFEMQQQGISVDKQALVDYSKVLGTKISVLEKEIYEAAGEEFNINSPKQLGVILFEKLGMPNGKKTKSGYSTAADVLEKLAPDYPVVSKILEYRQLAKLKSTYVEGLLSKVQPDGRIHTLFKQTETRTGRISSAEPNMQNIPVRTELGREMRKFFVAGQGNTLIDSDYSQFELRILAGLSRDENMIKAFEDGADIHAITASQIMGVKPEQVTKEMRSNAKAVNFGIVYGIGAFSLAKDTGITKEQASRYIENYFRQYPKVKDFMEKTVEQAEKYGFVSTLFNRRRYIHEIRSSNQKIKAEGKRMAMNAPIQGTSADIIKIAMVKIYRRLKAENLKAFLILQVHDEIIAEAEKNIAERVAEIIEEEMERAVDFGVKLTAEAGTGESWYNAKG